MAFNLQIEFSGLCLFVVSKKSGRVGVLMPDARMRPNSGMQRHYDGTVAVPHVGYVRFDLHDTRADIPGPPPGADGPLYEGIHRFNREALDLGFDTQRAKVGTAELAFPRFGDIAPGIELLDNLFPKKGVSTAPPPQLLMRAILAGGSFTSFSAGSNWTFPTINTPTGAPYQGQFPNYAVWTRRIDGTSLTLQFKPFDGSAPRAIRLTPRESGVVKLKIANLCAENPLEWSDLKLRTITGEEDVDFKWLYSLMKNPGLVPLTPTGELPVPTLDLTSGVASRDGDCTGGTTDGDF
jgi:hypothetical protein